MQLEWEIGRRDYNRQQRDFGEKTMSYSEYKNVEVVPLYKKRQVIRLSLFVISLFF